MKKKRGLPFQVHEVLDFTNFIADNALVDIGFSGSKFTWDNNQVSHERIWKRLDRVLVNIEWLNMPLISAVLHLSRTGFDHAPLLNITQIAIARNQPKISDSYIFGPLIRNF